MRAPSWRRQRRLDLTSPSSPKRSARASSVKMCRSVMIKGLEALTTECMLSARHYGVEDYVLRSPGGHLAARRLAGPGALRDQPGAASRQAPGGGDARGGADGRRGGDRTDAQLRHRAAAGLGLAARSANEQLVAVHYRSRYAAGRNRRCAGKSQRRRLSTGAPNAGTTIRRENAMKRTQLACTGGRTGACRAVSAGSGAGARAALRAQRGPAGA